MINEKDFIFDLSSVYGVTRQYDQEKVFYLYNKQIVKVGDYNYEIDLSGNVYFKSKCSLNRLDNQNISFKKDGLTGLINNEGVVIIPSKYKHIHTSLRGGDCYSICYHNWGLIDKNGNIKAPAIYKGELEYLNENYYVAYTMKGVGVVDDTGKIILPFEYQSINLCNWEKDKFICTNKNMKRGVVNTKNETIIPFEYFSVYPCLKSGKYKNCFIAIKEGRVGIINERNEIIIPFEYTDIQELSDETFLVSKKNNSYFIADDKFNKIRDVNFNFAINYDKVTSDYFTVTYEPHWCEDTNSVNSKESKYGLINKYGNLIIGLKYKKLFIINFNTHKSLSESDKLYLLAQNEQDKYGIIDVNENILVPFEYDYLSAFDVYKDYTIVAFKNKKGGIINIKDNNIIVDFVFDEIFPFDEKETTMAKYNGKWGVINKKGETLKFDLENAKDLDDLKYDVFSDVRQKQQETGFEYWVDFVEKKYPSIINQINNEPLLQSNKLKITPNIFGDYFGLFFKIESDFKDSYIELPFHEGDTNRLLLWLENIAIGKYHKNYLLLWGDGYWTSYFMAEIDKNSNSIKFVHVTDSIYGGVYVEKYNQYSQVQVYPATVSSDEFEPMTIRNAFIIDKKTFVKEFYNAYKKIVNIDVSKLEGNLYKDEISAIRKSSSLLEHYIN